MAKKKVTTTVEETEETPKDQEIDYKKDLEGKTFEQVATDTPKEEPKEEVVETPKEDETETIEFDPEQLKREAIDQAKAEVMESLKGDTKEETKENVSEYQEYQKEFLSKNNRQPTWFEVAEFMEGQAVKKLETKQQEQIKIQEEEKATQQKQLSEQNEQTNKYVKDTLDELYTADKLPKIQDAKDKDDYGLRVQNAFLKTVVEVNTKRIEQNIPPKTLKEVFYEDFKIPAKDVAGGNAPINMGRGGYTPDDTQELDYVRDIQGKSIRSIITNAFKRQ